MQQHLMTLMAGSAMLALTAGLAYGDCAADLARLTNEAHITDSQATTDAPDAESADPGAADMAADTTADNDDMSPADDMAQGDMIQDEMGQDDTAESDMAQGEMDGTEGVAKDGSLAPLEEAPGENDDVAMSEQDAEAQQDGQPTASGQAADAAPHGERETLLEQARTALAAGDEDACREALDAAARL